jgi:serine/threonine protein kinase/tetratricopeptide (TPR) repeat protein
MAANDFDPSEQTIFDEASRLTDARARSAYLDTACGGRPELRARIEKLLKAGQRADEYLAGDPIGIGSSTGRTAVPSEGPGDTIGKYRLLENIGEGGFGTVFMAEQREPIRRRVALKVIKIGMDTREVVARFEAERQALAMMDHPNIAKVLDAGATAAGRPYFVMELVSGKKITDYCDEKRLQTRKRLDLFISVCAAVQHAHQKGIIHRDLKPSNILVAEHDGVPVPKVIDFGIAKATQMKLTEKTMFTRFHQVFGTVAYMSPEQAQLTSDDIDTRSDVYSLGVLLYELLTGETPFDGNELLKAGLDEMRRTIREREPARPSMRLSTLSAEKLTTTAKRHGLESPKLISQLRGDLDWIVMKCLEKDRSRRYESATVLAADLERHLKNEPVEACPPSNLYRLGKIVRRNKMTFAAGCAILTALVLGLGTSTWMFLRERAARQRATRAEQAQMRMREEAELAQGNEAKLRLDAEANQKKAEMEKAKSEEVVQFFRKMLSGVGPAKALGRDTAMLREILDKTVEDIGTGLKTEPEVEAQFRSEIANVYKSLSLYEPAEAMQRKALELYRTQFGNSNTNVAEALSTLGVILDDADKYHDSEVALLESLKIETNIFGCGNPRMARTMRKLAWVLSEQGRLAEAEHVAYQALAMHRQTAGNDEEGFADSLETLGKVFDERNCWAEAETVFREALSVRIKFNERQPLELAATLYSLGNPLRLQGKLDVAEVMLTESLRLRRKVLGNEHGDVADSLISLGELLRSAGKLPEAESLLREGLAIGTKMFGSEHSSILAGMNNLALVLKTEGKLADAEEMYRQVLALERKVEGAEHQHVAILLHNLARVLHAEDKLADAESAERDAAALAQKVFGEEDPYTARFQDNLSSILRDAGDRWEAELFCREALATRRKICEKNPSSPAASLELAASLFLLADLTQFNGNFQLAESLARECLAIREAKQSGGWPTFAARCKVGACLLEQERYLEAEPLLLSGWAGLLDLAQSQPDRTLHNELKVTSRFLVKLYKDTSRTNEMAQWNQRLVELEKSETQ